MRKLRKGERYALLRSGIPSQFLDPSSRQDDRDKSHSAIKNIQIRVIGFILFSVFHMLFSDAQAQSAGERAAANGSGAITALRVGDYVPKDFWNKEVLIYAQGDTSRIKLETFRGKPFILDFWATWCGYCIAGFPELLTIRSLNGNNLNVLLVNTRDTKDTYEKIHGMTEDILRKNNLPSAILDEYLGQLFPHGPIPHYVWINPKGRVAGITFKEFVNSDQVEYFIKTNKRYEISN